MLAYRKEISQLGLMSWPASKAQLAFGCREGTERDWAGGELSPWIDAWIGATARREENGSERERERWTGGGKEAVSYTHLTLPRRG